MFPAAILTSPIFLALVSRLGGAIEAARGKVAAMSAVGILGPNAIPQVADVIRQNLADWKPEIRHYPVLRPEAREHFILGLADLIIQIAIAQSPRQD